jgi:hypothetical protein
MVAERRRQKEVESDPALPTGDRGHVHAFNTDRRRHAAASSRPTVEICTVSGDPAREGVFDRAIDATSSIIVCAVKKDASKAPLLLLPDEPIISSRHHGIG